MIFQEELVKKPLVVRRYRYEYRHQPKCVATQRRRSFLHHSYQKARRLREKPFNDQNCKQLIAGLIVGNLETFQNFSLKFSDYVNKTNILNHSLICKGVRSVEFDFPLLFLSMLVSNTENASGSFFTELTTKFRHEMKFYFRLMF